MGLDTVELVMDVEDKFDIVIWDADYPGIVTVGDLHALIMKRLQASIDPRPEPPTCPSMITFLKVRQFFVSAFNVGRSTIRPQTKLDLLLPHNDRDSVWYKLASHADLRLPELRRSLIENLAVFVSPLVLCGVLTVIAIAQVETAFAGHAAGCGFMSYLVLLSLLSRRIPRTLLPGGCEVVGDLVGFSLKWKYANEAVTSRYRTAGNVIDRDAVWNDLVNLICDQLGVKKADVTREARFIEDLSCG